MLTDTEIAALEEKYGKLARVHGRDPLDEDFEWELFLRRPTRPEYKSFRGMIHDQGRKAEAQETIVRAICVHPDKAGVDALLAKMPAIADGEAVGDIVGKMLGLTGAALGK